MLITPPIETQCFFFFAYQGPLGGGEAGGAGEVFVLGHDEGVGLLVGVGEEEHPFLDCEITRKGGFWGDGGGAVGESF